MVRRSQYHQSDAALLSQLEHIDWWERNKWSPAQEKHMHGYVKLSGNRDKNRSLWDAWHDRGRAIYGLQGDIGGVKSQSADAIKRAKANAAQIRGTQSDVSTLRRHGEKRSRDISSLQKWSRGTDTSLGRLGTRIGDLESRNYAVGDITGLEEQLAEMMGKQQTGDEQLTELMERYRGEAASDVGDVRSAMESDFLKKADYETSMADNLQALQEALRDEWGSEIEQLDLGAVRDAINLQRGDLSQLTEQFAGLQDVARIQGVQQAQGLEAAKGHRALIERELAGLTGEDVKLEEGIEGLRESLGSYKTDVAGQFGDVQKEYERLFGEEAMARQAGLSQEAAARQTGLAQESALRQAGLSQEAQARQAGLSAEEQARIQGLSEEAQARQVGLSQEAQSRIAGLGQEAEARQTGLALEAKTREEAIGALGSKLGKQLQQQESALSQRIDKGKEEVDKHLRDIAATMNYRMLGNQALGIRSRRSEAFKTGASSRGTGQLSRSEVNTLNIA